MGSNFKKILNAGLLGLIYRVLNGRRLPNSAELSRGKGTKYET